MSHTVAVLLSSIIGAFVLFGRTDGDDYIIPAVHGGYIYAGTGETGGGWQVTTSIQSLRKNIHSFNELGRRSRNSNIQLHGSFSTKVNIHCGRGDDRFYSPLPNSALGNKYIFSSCQSTSDDYTSVLMIATQSRKADVDITFKMKGNVTYGDRAYYNGDSLSVSLQEYQTWSIGSSVDLTGTVISSTGSTVAVFIKMLYRKSLVSFEQLLPVKHYGQEYVVGVDDNPALYQLQIISELRPTQILFNDGSTFFLLEIPVYRKTLGRNESLSFNTTRPVMATVCRMNRQSSGFMVVPPLSGYKKDLALSETRNMKLISGNTDVRLQTSSGYSDKLSWTRVPKTNFHIGSLESPVYLNHDQSAELSENSSFIALFLNAHDIYSGGYSFSNQIIDENYVIPSSDIETVYGAAGVSGGRWTVQSHLPPHSVDSHRIAMGPVLHEEHAGLYQLNDVDSGINVYGQLSTSKFSSLSISSLGRKYIVSSHLPSGDYHTILVIATHSQETDVDITFRLGVSLSLQKPVVIYGGRNYTNGDTLSLSTMAYTTYRIVSKYDLTGTIVTSKSASVAVFSGILYQNHLTALDQLLPVHYHGNEYVVALGSPLYSFQYQMQIVSGYKDAEIMFNDGSIETVGETGVYRRSLSGNETLYFSTSKPVMTTLSNSYGFVVVPPVSSYIKETVIIEPTEMESPREVVVTIMTTKESSALHFTPSKATVEWKDIPNSQYRVGTLNLHPLWFHTTIRSESRFSILVSGSTDFYNGGYDLSSADMTTNHPVLTTTQSPAADRFNARGDIIIIIGVVATGTAVSITAAMVYGGLVYYRRRRRRTENESDADRKKKMFDLRQRPAHPAPGGAPPLARI